MRVVRLIALVISLIPADFTYEAAAAQKFYSIASLNTADQFINAFEGFRVRMNELGYREGQRVQYQYYNSKGDNDLLKTLAQQVAQGNVDMIVTSSTAATLVAAKATEGNRIPVVFLSAGNPQKLVKSFSSSGSNLTGISSATLELTGKRFEILKEFAPATKKIAMPLDPKGVNYQNNVTESREAAAQLGMLVTELPVGNMEELRKIAPILTRKSYDAMFQAPDSLITEGIDILINQAIREKLPLMASLLVNVKHGCLAAYAADYAALGRQGAVLADKIFKGAKPSELPIELPQKLRLVLNLKTAKAIDLKVSKELLLRADEVIE